MSLQEHLTRFNLQADGAAFETRSSWLQPVQWNGQAAMLKIFKPSSDEKSSGDILRCFDGYGAVQVFAGDEAALVLERAEQERVLECYHQRGDEAAMDILLDLISRLHQPQHKPPPTAVPLQHWFKSLFEKAAALPVLAGCANVAEQLLNSGPHQLLHGDVHHENVLASGRGWLAIDPKGLLGDPAYEVANLFGNPLQDPATVLQPGRMGWLAQKCSHRLGLDERRVLAFAYAHAGLAVSWEMEDGRDFRFRQKCAETLEQLVKLA